jgi:xanthine dehydrogenase accessory factor
MTASNIWQWLVTILQAEQRAVLLLVVTSRGSSPGKAGAKMAISEDGAMIGTIGGGAVEYELLQQAKTLLAVGEGAYVCTKIHHPTKEHQEQESGQICGGEQTVLLYPCSSTDLQLFEQLADTTNSRRPCLLTLTPNSASLSYELNKINRPCFITTSEHNWQYQEVIGQPDTAYLIGGGHISLALAQILSLLEFDVVVLDERHNLKTMTDNSYAIQKKVVSYQQISNAINFGLHSYVVIMTHSHKTDQIVLEQLLNQPLAYLGMLGSARKVKQIKQNLGDKITPKLWQNLHAPCGLPICSETPMEIAISIAAEIIQQRNAKKRYNERLN